MIDSIDDDRGAYGIEPICKVLPIAPSTYHIHVAKRVDPRNCRHRPSAIGPCARSLRASSPRNFKVYGARKVWRQLVRESVPVARYTVERMMADLGLQG